MSQYEPVIGMEIHVELRTLSKMFCGCPADHFGKAPNTQTCPVCLGLPGALPVPNAKAIDWTMLIGMAINGKINLQSKFDRKHYFYPDLPKGYQISQYDEPLVTGGRIDTPLGQVELERIHLEEDTGKLQHTTLKGKKVTLVDFNRSGVPLVEIVTKPVIHSSTHAKAYAQAVRTLINFLQVSDADMDKGSLRLEANISLRPLGSNSLPPYKVEVKNINSFRFLEKAIDYEISRQAKLLDGGHTPVQETRGFNESKNATVSQRSKEEAKDYRYFPEPDIPPLSFPQTHLPQLSKLLPKLPSDYQSTFEKEYHIRSDYAAHLVEHRALAQKADAACTLARKANLEPQEIANWLINKKRETQSLSPEQLITAIKKATTISTLSTNQLKTIAMQVIKANPDLVAKYRSGKTAIIGVLIGMVLKSAHGQADPQLVKHQLSDLLG